jgi:hypothetical protein
MERLVVGIRSDKYNTSCFFDEKAGGLGTLLALEEGEVISVTGVLADGGDLARCEFLPLKGGRAD